MARLGSLEKGKRAEFAVLGELLRRGVVPYVPVVDIKGIDAIVRRNDGTLLEIQVKATYSEVMQGSFNVYDLVPRDNLFIIGVIAEEDVPDKYEYWIFPSKVFYRQAQRIPSKQGYTTFRLDLSYGKRAKGDCLKNILREYEGNWGLLTGSPSSSESSETE